MSLPDNSLILGGAEYANRIGDNDFDALHRLGSILAKFAYWIPLAFLYPFAVVATPTTPELYTSHCAECHGINRQGGIGPALLPGNLKRLRQSKAEVVIEQGRTATQMPAFGEALSEDQIKQLAEYIFTPPDVSPEWSAEDIRASRIIHSPEAISGDYNDAKPVYDADPLNLFLVVESGTHHVSVLDGDRMEPIHRFKSRFALHGGPKYSSTGRYVYFASRDGWISKFDMYRLEIVAEVRAGINTRNAALSADDRYLLVGNYLPNELVLLDANDLSLIKVIPVVGANGKSSRVSAVYTAPPRNSFIIALKDVEELWELNYADNPPLGFSANWNHDYRKDSGDTVNTPFPIKRRPIQGYLDDFFFDQEYVHIIGSSREGGTRVFDLDLGRVTHTLDLQGMPHLASGITWPYKDTTVLATPNIENAEVSIIDMQTWETIKRIPTKGAGFFMRSHENSPYAWVDVFFGENRDLMHVIDKQSLEIVKTLKPAPGKTSAHVEFTRDGSKALLSIWELDGELVVYDADTLEEIKRLPMSKPVGKYNVHNKITRSEGTSH